MQTVSPPASHKRIPVVFICQHMETPKPTLAAAQLPLSAWTRTGGSQPLSMDISVFSNSWLFTSALIGSLENASLKNCSRIAVGNLLAWALPNEVVHLWDSEGSCTPFSQRRGLSPFSSEDLLGPLLPHFVPRAGRHQTDQTCMWRKFLWNEEKFNLQIEK